jgi:hypothetical protein
MAVHTFHHDREPTLCLPNREKSCFACCPPIRPADYEHIQHRTIIQRILRENTRGFERQIRNARPVTGFSCWALGYLDDACRLAGCLLHPTRHQGEDLRFLTGYGEKCRRENCPESKMFLALSLRVRRFWLHLADDLDSFQYSSNRINPLFRVLRWGATLLDAVAGEEDGKRVSPEFLSKSYPVLQRDAEPRAEAYLLTSIARENGIRRLKETSFASRFERFSGNLLHRLGTLPNETDASFTHLLPFDPLFLDFLRLGAGIKKSSRERAAMIKHQVDTALSQFMRQVHHPRVHHPSIKRQGKKPLVLPVENG